MNWHSAASRIKLQRAQASNYQYASHRRYSVIADRFLTTVYNHVKIATPARHKVGDSIRVSKFKTVFNKSYRPNWTTEVFKIKVLQSNPLTYLLKDSRGAPTAGWFYELHSVANLDMHLVEKVLRKRRNEVYVKWLGFDNSDT